MDRFASLDRVGGQLGPAIERIAASADAVGRMADTVKQTSASADLVGGSTIAAADLRLDSESVRLQHDFSTSLSSVRLTLRVVLVDIAKRRVIATREFDDSASSASEDARGGVEAANRVVGRVLPQVASFCGERSSLAR